MKVFSVTFPGFAKNGAPHELIVNTDQIEGRAPVRASQKASRNEEKNGLETKTNKIMEFGVILGSFLEVLGAFSRPKAVRKSVPFSGHVFL